MVIGFDQRSKSYLADLSVLGRSTGAISRLEQEELVRALPPQGRKRPYELTRYRSPTPDLRDRSDTKRRASSRASTGRHDMDRLILWALPAALRERHGAELHDMLKASSRPVRDRADVVLAAIGLRLGRAVSTPALPDCCRCDRIRVSDRACDRELGRRDLGDPESLVVDHDRGWLRLLRFANGRVRDRAPARIRLASAIAQVERASYGFTNRYRPQPSCSRPHRMYASRLQLESSSSWSGW